MKLIEQFLRVRPGLSLDSGCHQRSRSPGNGAAGALKSGILDGVPFHSEPKDQPVATEWIVSLDPSVRVLHFAIISRRPIVVQDEILVQRAEVSHQANIFLTPPIASARISASSRVL